MYINYSTNTHSFELATWSRTVGQTDNSFAAASFNAATIIIIIIINYNVFGTIIMTEVIARVHPVHLMNVDRAPGARQPSDQANRLGLISSKTGNYHPHLPSPLLLSLSP